MDKRQREDLALYRFRLISPLLEPELGKAEVSSRREGILARVHRRPDGTAERVSLRTLQRYLAAYRKEGLGGLYPKTRSDKGRPRAVKDEALAEALSLKAELPRRSVRQVIETLEGLEKVKPGAVKPSTLARIYAQEGLNRLPKQEKQGFRRFAKERPNQLWQVDLKYGPYLPDPQDPKKSRRTYLIACIDDCSRLVTHAQFYLDQRQPVLENCFRKAILRRGIPGAVYVDNGKIFVSRWFRLACAKLSVRHLTAAPYSPEGKGKIERFMGTVDSFLGEVALAEPETLKELNEAFWTWLEEGYNHKPHASLKGKTPAEVFAQDSSRLRFATHQELRESFLWEEDRQVDRTGCFKLLGLVYDAGPEFSGQRVEVRFDPFELDEVELWQNGRKVAMAAKLDLSRRESRAAFLPPRETPKPDGSRYLDALAAKAEKRRKRRLGAISYRNLGGEKGV
jgi:transposase InsO family protein